KGKRPQPPPGQQENCSASGWTSKDPSAAMTAVAYWKAVNVARMHLKGLTKKPSESSMRSQHRWLTSSGSRQSSSTWHTTTSRRCGMPLDNRPFYSISYPCLPHNGPDVQLNWYLAVPGRHHPPVLLSYTSTTSIKH